MHGHLNPLPLKQGQQSVFRVLVVFNSGVNGLTLAVRRIAGIINKRTFFFTRRALFRRCLGLKPITAFITNPAGHGSSFNR